MNTSKDDFIGAVVIGGIALAAVSDSYGTEHGGEGYGLEIFDF